MKKKVFSSKLKLKKQKISNLKPAQITGGTLYDTCLEVTILEDKTCISGTNPLGFCDSQTLGPVSCPEGTTITVPGPSLPNGTVDPCDIL